MRTAFVAAMGLGLMLSAPVLAQTKPVATADQAAEHAVWFAEHDRWHHEHIAAAKKLEEIAAALRAPDDGLAEHGTELAAHSVMMSKTTDAAALAKAHAQLRAAHEEARIAHHELLDDLADLARVLREDRDTDAGEMKAAAAH